MKTILCFKSCTGIIKERIPMDNLPLLNIGETIHYKKSSFKIVDKIYHISIDEMSLILRIITNL